MLTGIIIFIFGLIIGSFLNVCIVRMPRVESIAGPRSRCPYCNNKINWYDNIPLISYILLAGKCRHCNMRISFQYFVVEFLTALVFLFIYDYYGLSIDFSIYALFVALLLVATFVDIKYRIIPDEVSLGGIVLGLFLSFIFPQMQEVNSNLSGLALSGLGVVAGAGITYLTGVAGSFVFKKEAMGLGDVKLMGAVGAFLGWKLAILTFFIAPFFGAVYGIVILLRKGSHLIAYGPFLSIAAGIALFYGENIIRTLFLGYY
ncbi:MAG TPA: prepilin peptidase [Candidatus Omnitrophica bacterium]|nr:prepilin peptidase [Candidatus Omnitrophota bacterium]